MILEKINELSWDNILVELKELNKKQPIEKETLNISLDKILNKFTIETDLNIKNECIELFFQLGAEPDLNHYFWNTQTLFTHYEQIKKYIAQDNQNERANLLLDKCFEIKNQSPSEEQALLAKLAFEYITDLDTDEKTFYIKNIYNALEPLKKAGLTNHQLLQLLYKTHNYSSSEGKDLQNSEIQKEVVNYLLQEGIKTSELEIWNFKLALPTATMLIDSYEVNPHILFLLPIKTLNNFNKQLDLLEKYNTKIPLFFILFIIYMKEELDIDLIERTVKNLSFKVDEPLDIKNEIEYFSNHTPILAEYFKNLSNKIDIYEVYKSELANNGSFLHFLAKNNKISFLEHLLNSQTYNINVENELGQTILFYASSPEIADLLIKHGINTTHKDNNLKTWIYTNPSIIMIEYALKHNFISPEQTDNFLRMYLIEGNFEHAAYIAKKHFKSGFNLLDNLVEIIITGIKESIENNKYQAIIHLMDNAGITIPIQHQHLLNNFSDSIQEENFDFIYGLIHKLAQHYINLVKKSFSKEITEENHNIKLLIDEAFKTLDFSKIKDLYPNNALLSQITDDFSAYTSVLSKASSLITNDLALEIMVLNGLKPAIANFNESISLYRGMKLDLSENDMNSYFKFGHQAFVNSNTKHKLLGFNVNQPWNKIVNAHWEYGGTYFSLDPHMASEFAAGITTANKVSTSILIESRFDKNIPKFCGSYKYEYEIISSNIPGNNIIAIYVLKIIKSERSVQYQVSEVFTNPYILATLSPKYKIGDNVTHEQDGKSLYNSLCNHLPIQNKHSNLYKNTTDFESRYSNEQFREDQKWLFSEYFADRDMFQDTCPIGKISFADQCEL